jgi:hypothetical protein
VFRINKPPFVIHSQSTMRMGLSAQDSVLDENAEARSVKRLFGGEDFPALLRGRSLGAERIAGFLGRTGRHACGHCAGSVVMEP